MPSSHAPQVSGLKPQVFFSCLLCQQLPFHQELTGHRDGTIRPGHNACKHYIVKPMNAPAAEDMIEITVSDTGSGFGDEVEQNLFQTFFTTKETGMGVGLSISRSIIEAHGGRMWAEANPSAGATFRFRLPAASSESLTDGA